MGLASLFLSRSSHQRYIKLIERSYMPPFHADHFMIRQECITYQPPNNLSSFTAVYFPSQALPRSCLNLAQTFFRVCTNTHSVRWAGGSYNIDFKMKLEKYYYFIHGLYNFDIDVLSRHGLAEWPFLPVICFLCLKHTRGREGKVFFIDAVFNYGSLSKLRKSKG